MLASLGKAARRGITFGEIALAYVAFYPYKWRWRLARDCPRRLHVGCGKNRFPGWLNADITPRAEIIVFLEWMLPFRRDFLDRIYCEHVLEHAREKLRNFLYFKHRSMVRKFCGRTLETAKLRRVTS